MLATWVYAPILGFASIIASPATSPMSQLSAIAAQNFQQGQAFLTANNKKPGVITLKDDLQYKIIQAGAGPKPTANSTVTVDYEGKLLDGTIFDSSYQRGQSATFSLSEVIPAWQEALPLMNTGATWQLYVPANLAYGLQGVPGTIGPNEVLQFKVHLISIDN